MGARPPNEIAAESERLPPVLLARLGALSAGSGRAQRGSGATGCCREQCVQMRVLTAGKSRSLWRCHVDATQGYSRNRNRCLSVATSGGLGDLAARKAARRIPMARLWFSARVSSAAQQQRSNVSFEGFNQPRSGLCAKLLVRRRTVLFRRTAFFPRPLEWRQFRSVLDLYAYRTDVELRMRLVERPIGASLWIGRESVDRWTFGSLVRNRGPSGSFNEATL